VSREGKDSKGRSKGGTFLMHHGVVGPKKKRGRRQSKRPLVQGDKKEGKKTSREPHGDTVIFKRDGLAEHR